MKITEIIDFPEKLYQNLPYSAKPSRKYLSFKMRNDYPFWLLFPLSLPVQQYSAADSHSEAEQDESEISKDWPWVPSKQADHTPVGSVPAAI